MKTFIVLGCVLSFMGLESAMSSKPSGPVDWVEQSTSKDTPLAADAQAHLRDAGPSGLEMLLLRYAPQIAAHKAGAPSDEQWKRIALALDKVGGQYDNYASGLFWYTDLEKAKAAARVSGRPILSLRLLGRLDEDLSCANSRFFRTTLYPSTEINQLLKDRYILHWESVRPAPRVTIDFGDGRKLERTITGNSIHYILDADGRVVDALPGLYSASAFAGELRIAADAMLQPGTTPTAYLNATRKRLLQAWAADLAAVQGTLPPGTANNANDLEARTDEATWRRIAQLHEGAVTFDAGVSELMARKFPTAQVAAPLADSKSMVETPMLRSFANLKDAGESGADSAPAAFFPTAPTAARLAVAKSAVEMPMVRALDRPKVDWPRMVTLRETMARDTVQNNYMRRTKILAFVAGPAAQSKLSLAAINNWVYGQVFLTPKEDPWLGLAPPDVFSAIEGDGRSNRASIERR
jgi:hypothetical protein